jgi:endo-1,4-beta-xylanase
MTTLPKEEHAMNASPTHGMNLGSMNYQIFATESFGGGSGNSSFTVNTGGSGGGGGGGGCTATVTNG